MIKPLFYIYTGYLNVVDSYTKAGIIEDTNKLVSKILKYLNIVYQN